MPIGADLSKKKVVQLLQDKFVKASGAIDRWWLTEDKTKLHEHALPVALSIRDNMFARRKQNYYYQMLYSDLSANMYQSQMGNSMSNMGNWQSFQNRITINVVQNCIDTAASIIAKNHPKPLFLTDGAKDYEMQEKAKKMTKYVAGVLDDVGFDEKSQRVFTDSCIYGTGALLWHIDDVEKKIKADWCFLEEILVDEIDGAKETPSQIHRLRFLARDEVVAKYPDFADDIMSCSNALPGASVSRSTSDMIPILESWHMKTTKDTEDGLHCIVCEKATLFSEHYDKDYFPLQFFRWYHHPIGFWGRGIAQELAPIQSEINEIAQTIQESQKMIAVPFWLVENGSMVVEDHLMSNDIGRRIGYSGTPPQIVAPQAVSQELYQHLWALRDNAYQIIGISQASATGTKEKEVKSGAAIRETQDIAAGRLEVVGQAWERLHIESAKIIVDLSKDLYQENKDLSINIKDKSFLSSIKWKDVDMEKDKFDIDVFPVSGLPQTPAGRMDTLMEWAQAGFVSKEQVMEMADFPDIKAYSDIETATLRLVQEIISEIKLKGAEGFKSPVPQMNLMLALSLANMECVNAEVQNIPEENIAFIRKFATDCQDLLNEAQQQMAPPPQAQPAPGSIAPTPPPPQPMQTQMQAGPPGPQGLPS
jgi:hypothetical protein